MQVVQITTQMLGAMGFGAVIGWYLYFINRYRKGDVQLGDLTTVIGAIGGAGVLSLFDKTSEAFGAYGIGLAIGFFGYLLFLLVLVTLSRTFTSDWFLDGRRPSPPDGWGYGVDAQGPVRTLAAEARPLVAASPGGVQNFYIAPPTQWNTQAFTTTAPPPGADPERR
jgi:hypothetical protein